MKDIKLNKGVSKEPLIVKKTNWQIPDGAVKVTKPYKVTEVVQDIDTLDEKLYLLISRIFNKGWDRTSFDTKEEIQAIKDLFSKREAEIRKEAVQAYKDKRVRDNKSFCGCMFCEHHSKPYETHVESGTADTKQESHRD